MNTCMLNVCVCPRCECFLIWKKSCKCISNACIINLSFQCICIFLHIIHFMYSYCFVHEQLFKLYVTFHLHEYIICCTWSNYRLTKFKSFSITNILIKNYHYVFPFSLWNLCVSKKWCLSIFGYKSTFSSVKDALLKLFHFIKWLFKVHSLDLKTVIQITSLVVYDEKVWSCFKFSIYEWWPKYNCIQSMNELLFLTYPYKTSDKICFAA